MSGKLRKAGLIGGVSWHSTVDLYRLVNERVAAALGGLNSAEMIIASVNLQDIVAADTPESKATILANAAKSLQRAGADFIALGSNGLHQFKDLFMQEVDIPFLHIADCVAHAVVEAGFSTVGLLGVRETMREDFYISHLAAQNIRTMIPTQSECSFIDSVLFRETGMGVVKPSSAARFYTISDELYRKGAQGVILGCTEIRMLMHQSKTKIPLFDSTEIYAKAIASRCIEDVCKSKLDQPKC